MKTAIKLLFLLIGFTFCWISGSYCTCLAENHDETKINNKLDFGANIRFRYEYQDNFNLKYYGDHPKKGKSNDQFLLGRFRLGFDYRPNEIIHASLWMQHSEAWDLALGEDFFYNNKFEQRHNPYEDSWELYNTYIEIKEILPFDVKIGRQIITYGNKRIFGPGQWGNTGVWIWDAAKLSYKFQHNFVDAFYGKTMIHDPNHFSLNHSHGFETTGFYSHFELPQNFFGICLEPFGMTKKNNRDYYKAEDGQLGDFDSYYIGARIFRKNSKGFDCDFTYVKQNGDYSQDNINAYGYHILMAYNFDRIDFKPRVSVEFSYASGDSNPNDGNHETFDAAFGARDKMYGRMNLFHWKNLKDCQITLEIKPKKWLCFKAEYHQFWLAQDKDAWYLNSKEYRDKTGNSGDKVGKEFDILGELKLFNGNELQFGYGHFWPDEFAKKQASNKQANWIFLQWMYTFSHKFF